MRINQDIQEPTVSSKKNTITVKKEDYIDFFNENKNYLMNFLDFSNWLLSNPNIPQNLRDDAMSCKKPTLDMIEGKDCIEIDLDASFRYISFAKNYYTFVKQNKK